MCRATSQNTTSSPTYQGKVTEDTAAQAWEKPVFVLHFVLRLTLPERSKNPACSVGRWLAVFDRTEEAGLTEEAEEMEKTPVGPSASVSM